MAELAGFFLVCVCGGGAPLGKQGNQGFGSGELDDPSLTPLAFRGEKKKSRLYEAQSLNTWNQHVQISVVSVDHKQQLIADRSERWT